MMKKVNIAIISIAVLAITIETIRGNKPWKARAFSKKVFQENKKDLHEKDKKTKEKSVCIESKYTK